MTYSITYIGSIAQALVVLGLFTNEEAVILTDGVLAVGGLIALGVTLYGRWRAGGVNLSGIKN